MFITSGNSIATLKNINNSIGSTELIKTDVDNIKSNRNLNLNGITSSWSIIRFTNKLDKKGYFDKLNRIKQINGVEVVSPFFKTNHTEKVGLSNYFYVKLRKEGDLEILRSIAKSTNTKIIEQDKFMPLWFTLSCTRLSKGNALEMANYFYETSKFAYAEPDLMVDDILNCATDPLFNNQWGLNNTGQNGGTSGIDINVCNAWNITTGASSIKVAIVDNGIQMNHPDLQTNIFGTGYDTENGTSPSLLRGVGLGDHATSVAGIIAAVKNNSLGVSGVAPNCQLISVSTSPSSTTNARKKKAEGINWAWQNGADIISNSWGWDPNLPFQEIDDAIDNALTQGRGGKGCVVVFSVGNGNSNVAYPANSNANILAVGAATYCGERKSPSSCDNDNTWGSNYGNQLDIMAPGVSISTTDKTGSGGYATGDYTNTFDKTSAAAPFVAGVAALMLSVNPNLTAEQVNEIIESTAQKVGTYSYSPTPGRTSGSWNNEMGYGLIDAYAAVCRARAYANITDLSFVCTSNSTFTLSSLAAGNTVTWSKSSNLTYVSGQGTANYVVKASSAGISGVGWVEATISSAGCDGVTLPREEFWVGKPTSITGSLSGPSSVTEWQLTWYSVPDQSQEDGTFFWTTPLGFLRTAGGNGYRNVQTWIQPYAQSGYVQVWKTNICGNGGAKYKYVTVTTGGGCGICPITQMSPNPASDQIDISFVDRETSELISQKKFEEPREYVITDFEGYIVYRHQSKQTNLKLDISQIKQNGLYVLNIKHGSLGTDRYRLIIER